MKFKSETEASTDLIEAIYNWIELQEGEELTVKSFVKHLEDSYSEDEE